MRIPPKSLSIKRNQQQRKLTAVSSDAVGGGGEKTEHVSARRFSNEESVAAVVPDFPTVNSTMSARASFAVANTGAAAPQQQRGSLTESKRVQGLRQNTRMLLAVILLFLVRA